MFERYIEKARRIIFFARYEAIQYGSATIGTEHMLLALFREDPQLMGIFLSTESGASIRPQIDLVTPPRGKTSGASDLPLSDENKRVLAYAAQEATSLKYGYIGPQHLLLGLLCEAKCFAATLLHERGVTLDSVRAYANRTPEEQRGWPNSETRYKPKRRRMARGLRDVLVLLMGVFIVQISTKAYTHELSRSEAIKYAIAAYVVAAALFGLTFWLRRPGRVSSRELTRVSITILIVLLAAWIPILAVLLK